MSDKPRSGDVAYYEGLAEGGDPYRVTVVWRHTGPGGQGWYNVAGTLKPLDVTGKDLHLLVREGHPMSAAPTPDDGLRAVVEALATGWEHDWRHPTWQMRVARRVLGARPAAADLRAALAAHPAPTPEAAPSAQSWRPPTACDYLARSVVDLTAERDAANGRAVAAPTPEAGQGVGLAEVIARLADAREEVARWIYANRGLIVTADDARRSAATIEATIATHLGLTPGGGA